MSDDAEREKKRFQGIVKKVATPDATPPVTKDVTTPPPKIIEKYVKRVNPVSTGEPPTPAPKKKDG